MRATGYLALGLFLSLVCSACGDDDGQGNQNNENGNQNGNQNTAPVCGNGTVEAGEVCDDGTENSDSVPDACRTTCREPWCGDGVADSTEDCDDGDDGNNGADACPSSCEAPACGDGHVHDGVEVCDDGNTVDGDDCSADCGQDMTVCGNGSPDDGEECDQGDGTNGDFPNTCRADCSAPVCGDGIHDDNAPYGEACDLGAGNSDQLPNTCRTSCEQPWCGDGVIDDDVAFGAEVCDGVNLPTSDCAVAGLGSAGTLTCLASCAYDTSGCTPYPGHLLFDMQVTNTCVGIGDCLGTLYVALYASDPETTPGQTPVVMTSIPGVDAADTTLWIDDITLIDVPSGQSLYLLIFLDDDGNADPAAPYPSVNDYVPLGMPPWAQASVTPNTTTDMGIFEFGARY